VPHEVVACAEAGLAGYVPCTASIADLVGAVRRVARGDTVCSVAMADGLFQHLRGVALGGYKGCCREPKQRRTIFSKQRFSAANRSSHLDLVSIG